MTFSAVKAFAKTSVAWGIASGLIAKPDPAAAQSVDLIISRARSAKFKVGESPTELRQAARRAAEAFPL